MNMTTAARHPEDERVTIEWQITLPIEEAMVEAVKRMRELTADPHHHLVGIAVWFAGDAPFYTCRIQYDDSSEKRP
jgi:hypothetical protein